MVEASHPFPVITAASTGMGFALAKQRVQCRNRWLRDITKWPAARTAAEEVKTGEGRK